MKRWHLLAAAIAALILWHAWASQFNHDEIEHLHAAWLVAHGARPYTDFLEQHHPTLWYLLAPSVGLFQSVRSFVFAARLFDLACLAGLLAIFVRLFRRLYPGARVRWPLLVLVSSFMFVRDTLEVRPDPLMNFLVYGALLSWVAFLQDHRRLRAAAAGVLFGAAVVVLQKALVVLALVVAASLLLAVRHRADRVRSRRLVLGAGLMVAAAVGPVVALFAAIAARGFWNDFWFWNYQFNRFFYLQAELCKHFSVLVTLGISVAEDAVLWIAGAGGMFLCARQLWRDRRSTSGADDPRSGLLVVALGYLPFLCFNRFPLEQYFIVLLPLLALFSAEVFARAVAPRPRAILQWSSGVMAFVLAGILLLYPGNGPQRDVQDVVLAQTAPDEPIFMPPPYNPVFRRDAGYFWYNGKLIGDAYAQYCETRQRGCAGDKRDLDDHRWQSHPPRFVYLYDPEYYPVHWKSRSRDYEATTVPGLLRASAALSSRVEGAGEAVHARRRFLQRP